MVNLQLTESELVFLQRLIGHNMAWNGAPDRLYDKIADKTMVNLELTESELVFLQRLISHNMAWNSAPPSLYDKIVGKTDALGIPNSSSLNLKDVSKESWYFTNGYNRLILKLEE